MLFSFPLSMARTLLLFSLLSLLIISCKKETQESKSAPVETSEVETLKSFLSERIGVSIKTISFDEKEQRFVIGGDAMMSLESAKKHLTKSTETAGARTTQSVNKELQFVSTAAAKNVKVYASFEATVTAASEWQTAIDIAIANWNKTDCLIKMTRVSTAASANIVFRTFTSPNSGLIANSDWPDSDGNVGPTVDINTTYWYLSVGQKSAVIMHEFGHTFGFAHTNESVYWTTVSETPATDAGSIMNVPNKDQPTFSYYDIIAFGIIYPNAPNTKRFLRYYSNDRGTHIYTLSSTELNAAGSSYGFEKGEGYMYPTQVTGTVPVYRYNNSSKKDHIYTTNYSELGAGMNGYVAEGITGYIYPTQVAGTRPLYRYHNNNKHDHFYTVDINELGASGSGGYVPENPFIIGYLY